MERFLVGAFLLLSPKTFALSLQKDAMQSALSAMADVPTPQYLDNLSEPIYVDDPYNDVYRDDDDEEIGVHSLHKMSMPTIPTIECGGKIYENLPELSIIEPKGLWCPVQKAGTSTVYRTIDAGFDGQRKKSKAIVRIIDLIKQGKRAKVCDFLRMDNTWIVIRNPWERVKSAYLDKVVKGVHGKPSIKVPGIGGRPSFMQMLSYLNSLNQSSQKHWNVHVAPASILCRTGKGFNYQQVIRLERDFDAGLLRAIQMSGRSENKVQTSNTNQIHMTTKEFYDAHGGDEAVRLVGEIYKDDIKFGNYKFTP